MAARPDAPGGTVLVIDDEEVIREGCVQILADEGHRVETARDGVSGIERAAAVRPDVVLLDIRMPGMSGMDAIARLLERDPTLAIVMITGHATVDAAVVSLKSGAFDFLAKPFTPLELRAAVRHGLEKRRLAADVERLRAEKKRMAESFVSVVTHQLRAPIAAVQQYFQILLGGMAGEIPPRAGEILDRANGRLGELMAIIEDWLSLARHDREAAEFRPLDLAVLVRRHMAFLHEAIAARRLLVEIGCEPGLPPVPGDEHAIGEAFANLVSNAVKYNRDGGTIAVAVRRAEGRACIEVRDTGIGIPPEQRELVFQEFHRVRSRETENIPGTGLGLPIVKRIAERHGGSVELESEVGKGSTFRLWLPIHTAAARASPLQSNPGDPETANRVQP